MPTTDPRRGERRYVYRSAFKRLAAGVFDALGTAAVRIATGGWGLRPRAESLTSPRRILVVRLDHLGDVCFSRPALAALKAGFPEARLTTLTSGAGAELMRRDPNVDEALVWEAPWFARPGSPRPATGFLALARDLRRRRFDLALDLRGDLRHLVLLWLAGVPARAGYGITGGGFLAHVVPRLAVGTHEVERGLDLAAAVGATARPRRFTPLRVSAAERRGALARWQGRGPRVLVHPGAGDPAKRWPAARFAQVCDALTAAGCRVALIGTASEQAGAAAVRAACPRPLEDWCGRTSLAELLALIDTADLVLGHDSGPAHLAVTQGVPAVLLWSETNDPQEWGPWGEGAAAAVVRQPGRDEAGRDAVAAARRLLTRRRGRTGGRQTR